MTRIAALNDFAVGSSDEEDVGPTREALEAEASKNYNEAIRRLAAGKLDQAYDQFCLVLQNPFIEKACWPEGVEPGGVLPQDLALRYSCLKNLGNLASKRGEYDQSVEYYMEAVRLDRTDVTLWQRLGAAAIKLKDFELSLVAFQEGFNVNPKHWPCLDQLLSVLFILKMYVDCLGLAIGALQRDPGYIKALAFKDKIFEIQPSLKEDVKFFFRDSSVLFKNVDYDKAKGDKFITTCETLRPPNKTPPPPCPIPCQQIRKPLSDMTWDNLAQSLIATYDALMEEDGLAFAGRIDVYDALNHVSSKISKSEMEDLGVTPLESPVTPGRKDKAKDDTIESYDGKQRNSEKEGNLSDGVQGNPIRIIGRRRTIELGESQDSFRVSEKRRSVDSDISRQEDTKSSDIAIVTAELGSCKEELLEKKSEKEVSEKELSRIEEETEGNDAVDKSEEKALEHPEDNVGLKGPANKEKVLKDNPELLVRNNNGKQSKEVMESQGKEMNATEKETKATAKVLSCETSGERTNEGSNMKLHAIDEESDNDFQGFTNASAYKEKHLKLVQGKSALSIVDDMEDFGLEPCDELETQGQESDCTAKVVDNTIGSKVVDDTIGSKVVHDTIGSKVVDDTVGSGVVDDTIGSKVVDDTIGSGNTSEVIKDKDKDDFGGFSCKETNDNHEVCIVEMKNTFEKSHASQEGEEEGNIENLQLEDAEQVDVGNADKDGYRPSEGTNECGNEEQEQNEGEKVLLQPAERDDDQEVECNIDEIENEDMAGGREEENDDVAIEENEDGVMEQTEDAGIEDIVSYGVDQHEDAIIEENEGVNMEQNEHGDLAEIDAGIEENDGMIEENECGLEENEMGVLDDNDRVGDENEGYPDDEGMDVDGMLGTEVTETEAAVNALKGIMALQPTEILGLPEPDFDYESEYAEYFDGGVYEEEEDYEGLHRGEDEQQEEQDMEEDMNQGEDEQQEEQDMEEDMNQGENEQQEEPEDSQQVDESQENTEQGMDAEQEFDNVDGTPQDASRQKDEGGHDIAHQDGVEDKQQQEGENVTKSANEKQVTEECEDENNQTKSLLVKGKQNENQVKANNNREKDQGTSSEGEIYVVDKDDSNKNTKRDTDADDNTTTEASDKAEETPSQANVEVARKSKRTKRGLERELEQLDYWGRRQERDAKRRRRTISSKLLGAIEEAEYLTWADLLRSFVPASLLSVADDKKKKPVEGKTESKSDSQVSNVVTTIKDVNDVLKKDISSKASSEGATPLDESAKQKDAVILTNGCHSNKDIDNEMSNSILVKTAPSLEKPQEELNSAVADVNVTSSEKAVGKEDSKEEGKDVIVSGEGQEEKMDVDIQENDCKHRHEDAVIFSSSSAEEEQVQAFLLRYEDNGGVLHLLQQFLKIMVKRYKFVWPLSVAKVFTEAYPRVRNHVFHGSPLNLNESRKRLYDESLLSLTHWELSCSIYQSAKLNTPVSDRNSLHNPFTGTPSHLDEDMFRLMLMLGRGDVWVEETPQFHTRLRWLQAQMRLIRGQPEDAVSYLELLLTDLDRLASEGSEYVCNRVRVESDNIVVCNSEVKRQLNVLQRSHMLEQVVDNYTDCRYRVVADLLTTIFHEPLPKSRPGVTLPTRQTQLAILVDSLYKLSEYKDVMTWGSQALSEALMRYNRAEAEEEKNRWAKTLMKITDTMNIMLTKDITVVCNVDRERLVEVVSTLIRMLVVQLEKPQSAQILPFETLTPWMLLHRLLAYEESLQDPVESKKSDNVLQESNGSAAVLKAKDNVACAEKRSQILENTKQGDVDVEVLPSSKADGKQGTPAAGQDARLKVSEVPVPAPFSKGPLTPYPSTLFLITAHDELGKHSWCCCDDGIFLLYCLDVLLVELRRLLDDQHRQLLHQTLEQVTFCLYSHPSKKSKHKHLRDHGVPQIAFCWERAMQLYQYYKPCILPDFQTCQIPSITDDAAALFKRIIALLPNEAKPADQTSGVEAYINGEVAECTYMPFSPPTDIIRDCFYLLGDYYFKSKEWMNAIKYYKLDLSINQERLESWAPLGLSMKAILESQLNSCEVIEDEEAFFSLAKAAVQCLRQALKLDRFHTNLWVEFGGLVYMVHSHASRLLKQDLNPDISLETFDMLEKLKSEMLTQAELCFTRALSIQEEDGWDDEGLPDERWLHCYMLGKVAEKMNKPPQVIIQYYMKASRYLHNIRAKYPLKINYNSPQEFSVEALEMYYRVHAFMLKYLHQREGRDVEPEIMDTFGKFLDELATGSFTNCREKKNSDEGALDIHPVTKDVTTPVNEDGTSRKRPLGDNEFVEPPSKRLQSDTGLETGPGMDIQKDAKLDDKNPNIEVSSKDGNSQDVKTTSEKEKKESDDEIQVVEEKVIEKKDHYSVISRCLAALRTCLSRFQEHYKAMYRLGHYYHTSKFHKDNNKAQNYLLGCQLWQNVGYMPVNGLFHERKVWIQQPKNSNFFHGVWRIPNDEIDRPGSFAAHMYRCVSLILDILPQMKDFFMILQIALALKNSPDKDKKYLRDNERELLSEHATQVGLQAMKDRYKVLFKGSTPVHNNRHLRFLLDVYKCYKQISKHLPGSEPHFAKMLTDAYASHKNIKVENRSNVLREADSFCNRHQYLQHRTPVSASNINNPMGSLGNIIPSPVIRPRGRPPLTGRGRGRGRGSTYGNTRTVGDMLAVQQAYKIYESLIHTQTLLNKKTMKQSDVYSYQKQLEGYQAQLMKYLTIPCVSQYFQSSLQGLGATTTKLPPPKNAAASSAATGASVVAAAAAAAASSSSSSPSPSSSNTEAHKLSSSAAATHTVTNTNASNQEASGVAKSQSSSQSDQQKSSLSALAARSQAHGISITSVSATKVPSSQNKPFKPSMSVTVSSVKSTVPSVLKGRDVSVVSVSHTTSPVKTSTSISPSKTDAIKLPSSTTATFKTATSSSSTSVSTTIEPSSVSGNSSTFKPRNSSVETTFKPRNSSGDTTTLKTSSGSSVPKLPAGTTLTRPRGISPNKGSAPRPQLQANPRTIKSTQLDTESSTVNKVMSQILANSVPVSSESSSSLIPSTTLVKKPTLPKDMTITPAPRVKTQPRQQLSSTRPPASSPSTSFFRAFEASLGLSSSNSTSERTTTSAVSRSSNSAGSNRSVGRSPTTSISNAPSRVAQLSANELMQLAYGSGRGQTSAGRGQIAGGRGQLPGGRGQTSGGRGQASSSISTAASQYSKSQQQQRGQLKQSNSQYLQGSSNLHSQNTIQKSLPAGSSLSLPQTLGSQQQLSNPQQSRPAQQTSSISQSKTVAKPNLPKPPQKTGSSSDDIITLD